MTTPTTTTPAMTKTRARALARTARVLRDARREQDGDAVGEDERGALMLVLSPTRSCCR